MFLKKIAGLKQITAIGFVVIMCCFMMMACKKDGGGINIFSIQDDLALGAQVDAEIEANPVDFPILDPLVWTEAYDHLERIRDEILDNADLNYRDVFPWEVHIIEDDDVLNAFATPGGYIYVYTGLIKYLESEDQLAGVLGHEIAHSDLRHTTDMLTEQYGLSLLIGIVLGNDAGALVDLAYGLTTLAFSRGKESQSDEFSVKYLCPTEYDARGAARFFEKLEDGGAPTVPQFLSTHPNPGNRVDDINAEWAELGCGEGGTFDSRYQDFVLSLP